VRFVSIQFLLKVVLIADKLFSLCKSVFNTAFVPSMILLVESPCSDIFFHVFDVDREESLQGQFRNAALTRVARECARALTVPALFSTLQT
jgi:hypothetical protein